MGWARLLLSIGRHVAKHPSALGVNRPHVRDVGEWGRYKGISAIHRIGHNDHTIAPYDMGEAIRELPSQSHISVWWLEKALRYVHQESGVRTIMMYLCSAGAANLSKSERAHLYAECLGKLRHLEMLKDFM